MRLVLPTGRTMKDFITESTRYDTIERSDMYWYSTRSRVLIAAMDATMVSIKGVDQMTTWGKTTSVIHEFRRTVPIVRYGFQPTLW